MSKRVYFSRFSIGEKIRTRKYGTLMITDAFADHRVEKLTPNGYKIAIEHRVWANNTNAYYVFKVSKSGRILEEISKIKK